MRFCKLKTPINVQWELTPSCNYNCFHCYNYWRLSGNIFNHIEYDIVTKQLIESHIYNVTLTGGEPLLVFDEIKPYIEKMVQAGIKILINTNASLLTKEMAEFFKNNNIGLLISLPCCIPEINDRITTVKGSFNSTVKGIKVAKLSNVPLSINMVVTKLNKDYVVDTAAFLHDELGINSINVTKASRPINGSSKFDEYALNLQEFRNLLNDLIFIKKEYSMFVDSLTVYPECSCDSVETYRLFTKRKCFAGKTSLAIGYNGDVKACARDSVSYGNLANKSLKDCWENMEEWRNIPDKKLPPECMKCNLKYSCLGGCRIDYNNEIPNKCYRDKNNEEIENFIHKDGKSLNYLSSDRFVVPQGQIFMEEEFGMRGINLKKDTFFISRPLYKFMTQFDNFSKQDLIDKFKISNEEANKTILYLIKNEAIRIL